MPSESRARDPHFLAGVIDVEGPVGLRLERTGVWLVSRLQLATDSDARRRGLLGRTSFDDGEGLVIAPCQGVHTFGMRFDLDVVGVARDGRIVRVRAGVRPNRVVLALSAWAILELPAGSVVRNGVQVQDRLIASASSSSEDAWRSARP